MRPPIRRPHRPRRHAERGGITILTVLALLALVTVFAFSLGKGAIRELVNSGTVWQSAKASEAADAGLEWYLMWANTGNASLATAYRRNDLLAAITQLNLPGDWQTNPYHADATTATWDRSATLTSAEGDTNTDLVFDTTGAGYLQSKTQVKQSFDLFFRYLGSPTVRNPSSGSDNAAGQGGATGRSPILYQVLSTGKASVPNGTGGYMRYQSTREMYLVAMP